MKESDEESEDCFDSSMAQASESFKREIERMTATIRLRGDPTNIKTEGG